MYTHEGPDLYLAADQETVVAEGDPRARYVLVVNGAQLSDEDAEKYGLTGEKAKEAAPNKARTASGENKGRAARGADAEVVFEPDAAFTAEPLPEPKKGK